MAKEKITATIEQGTNEQVVKLADKENRNYSNMVETLLDEAILARIVKSTKKKK